MQKLAVLRILMTTERKGVSNHPATFAFSTKYQMMQRLLVHLRRGSRSTVFCASTALYQLIQMLTGLPELEDIGSLVPC